MHCRAYIFTMVATTAVASSDVLAEFYFGLRKESGKTFKMAPKYKSCPRNHPCLLQSRLIGDENVLLYELEDKLENSPFFCSLFLNFCLQRCLFKDGMSMTVFWHSKPISGTQIFRPASDVGEGLVVHATTICLQLPNGLRFNERHACNLKLHQGTNNKENNKIYLLLHYCDYKHVFFTVVLAIPF